MLLIDTTTAAKGLDVSCGIGREAASAADTLVLPLNMILPRVEAACEVKSLERKDWTDYFRVYGRGYDGVNQLRLENGFIDPEAIQVIDSDGGAIAAAEIELDAHRGVVAIPNTYQGTYRVEYSSGFQAKATKTADDVDIPVEMQVLDVPAWLQSLAILALNEWFRSAPKNITIKDNLSFSAVNAQANRAIVQAVWRSYMRPHSEVVWAARTIAR